MPRLSEVVYAATKPYKKFTNYTPLGYKYKIVLPPVLRDYVSSKKDKSTAAYCVEEMSVMMACWKRNDFNQQRCSSELRSFHKCVMEAQAAERAARIAAKEGKSADGSGRLPSAQVNKLLNRYPQPPHDIRLKLFTDHSGALWTLRKNSFDLRLRESGAFCSAGVLRPRPTRLLADLTVNCGLQNKRCNVLTAEASFVTLVPRVEVATGLCRVSGYGAVLLYRLAKSQGLTGVPCSMGLGAGQGAGRDKLWAG
ncbi:hypothetical protein BaRGS_00002041, partial [Batillaria attramentaria]